MATKGAIPLTEAELIEETAKRLPGLTSNQVRSVFKALKDEIVDCVTSGYKINLVGIASFEPTVKAGRKKGTVVNNPFDGTSKTLRADEPDKFVLKVKKSGALTAKFPTMRTKDGQALHAQLYVKPKPAKKK